MEIIPVLLAHPLAPLFSIILATAGQLLLAVPTLKAVLRWLGWKRGVFLFCVLGCFAYLFEGQALITGWPYGEFSYTQFSGYLLGGLLPLGLPFAWVPLLLASVVVGQAAGTQLKHTHSLSPAATVAVRIVVAACFLTLCDFVLDPVAARLGLWVWAEPSGFYGVPWSNFAGWLLSGLLGAALYEFWAQRTAHLTAPHDLTTSCRISLLLWLGLALFLQLWLPAVLAVVLVYILSVVRTR